MSSDYFDFHYDVMRFFLLIPPERIWLRIIYYIIAIPHFTLQSLSIVLESKFLISDENKNLNGNNILTLGIIFMHSLALNRVLRWHIIKTDYERVLKYVKKVELNFSLLDYEYMSHSGGDQLDFQKPKSLPIRQFLEENLYILGRTWKFRLYLILSYIFLNMVILSPTLSYFNPTYEKWNTKLNKTSLYRDYTYHLWYPFDISITDGYYVLGNFYQSYAFTFLMSGFFCVDWLGVYTIAHISVFIKTLGRAFRFIDKNDDDIQDNQALLMLKAKRITKCITQLGEIYQCANMVDDFLSPQLLIQGFLFAGVICCCVYKVTTDMTSLYEIGYLAIMTIVAGIQLLLVSYNNEIFTSEMSKLVNAIYAVEWINYNTEMKKILIFLIRRVQKPFYFTMGLGFPLDIGVFLTMMKHSYSLYTLLTQSARRIQNKS